LIILAVAMVVLVSVGVAEFVIWGNKRGKGITALRAHYERERIKEYTGEGEQ